MEWGKIKRERKTEEEMEETEVITRSENGTPIVVLRVVTDQKPLVSPRQLLKHADFQNPLPQQETCD